MGEVPWGCVEGNQPGGWLGGCLGGNQPDGTAGVLCMWCVLCIGCPLHAQSASVLPAALPCLRLHANWLHCTAAYTADCIQPGLGWVGARWAGMPLALQERNLILSDNSAVLPAALSEQHAVA